MQCIKRCLWEFVVASIPWVWKEEEDVGGKAGQVFGLVRTIRLGLKVYSSCSFHSPKGNILSFPTLCKVKYVFIALG